MFKVTPVKLKCNKCGHESVGMDSHVNRFHKKCGNSTPNESRKTHGKLERAS